MPIPESVHRLGMRIKSEVAEAVEDNFAFINLDAFQHVGMVPKDEVGPRVNGSVSHRGLVTGDRRTKVMYAPVERENYDISGLARPLDVAKQFLEIFANRIREDFARCSRLVIFKRFVVGDGTHWCDAGFTLGRVVAFRS